MGIGLDGLNPSYALQPGIVRKIGLEPDWGEQSEGPRIDEQPRARALQ